MLSNIFLVFLCATLGTFVVIKGSSNDLYEGDPCIYARTGVSAVCKRVTTCQSALDAFNQGIDPQTCSFDRNVLIVCCGDADVTTTEDPEVHTTEDPFSSRLGFDQHTKKQLVEKAERMCECYHNYQSPTVQQCDSDGIEGRLGFDDFMGVDPSLYIKGGENASSREFPHMVALGYDSVDGGIDWACGGSLISNRHVLTAAHCLAKGRNLVRLVRIGDVNMRDNNGSSVSRQQFLVVNRTVHPDYSARTIYHDIAILTLNSSVTFSEYARPACLNTEIVAELSQCTATGWGIDNWQSTEGSSDLRKVELQVHSPTKCSETYASLTVDGGKLRRGFSSDLMMCVGDPEGIRDTCNGDSGGPIQVVSASFSDMHSIIGVTSFGTACGPATAPAIYTRVSSYVPWIVSVVWPGDYTSETPSTTN